jgi:uncharacterized protein (DUF486 family)
MNTWLKIAVSTVAALSMLMMANHYLHFGWFGPHAKAVSSAMLFVLVIALVVAIRLWREPE